MRNAGLVQSTRGAAGGYKLARDPRAISLKEVMHAVEGGGETKNNDITTASSPRALLNSAWDQAEEAQDRVLEQISFAQLAEKLKQRVGTDYTI
jgi:Rrf2 family protein